MLGNDVTAAMPTTITFSVIIPVYNRAAQLAACVASIRSQSYRDFELIVVDDGSTDGTCDQFADDGDLMVVTKTNGGPAAARNHGASVARGEFLFFLDSDDVAFPWTLAVYAEALHAGAPGEASRPAIICGNFIEFAGLPPQLEQEPALFRPYRDYLEAAQTGLYAAGGMVAIRRDVFSGCGGFDHQMKVSEDHDLMLRLGERAGFIHITSPATYAKRHHEGSISNSLTLLYAGCVSLLEHFRSGAYGTSRRAQRIAAAMVGAHVRTAIVALARGGLPAKSADLYRRSFRLNLGLGRWKFLIGGPAVIAAGLTKMRRGK